MTTDVLVVGGGPVGLAAAVEARLAGLSVVVVEPREGEIDKACGEGLMPGALDAVHRLGVDPAGHPLLGVSYRSGRRHADHLFSAGPGRGVRRTTLHAALRERAAALGVEHVTERVTAVEETADTVAAAGVEARWLLACDGLHSSVRRIVGLDVPTPPSALPWRRDADRRRFGLRRHFRVRPWNDLIEVHWGDGVEAYVTPVADDVVGVALLGPPRNDFAASLAGFHEISEHLRGAEPLGAVRGAGPLRQASRRRTAGRVRLVGDASGYVDALTGEGLRVGLAQARAAVACLEDPAGYERAWSAATRDYRLLTSGLVAWAQSPARRGIVPVAGAAPGLYGWVVDRLAR
ncbi:NAD(P)/FAD-dependent oxidoreductase [Paraoerskovia marina]|uniref:NAD(P)/FAD-dependent oxidoreductase n=1 Tax=Paraoerskovia marina TaxID=545619 RepID=UPI0004922A04|nr:FAD-dependent monooxygenase [Paraoerskovia marina]